MQGINSRDISEATDVQLNLGEYWSAGVLYVNFDL